MINFDSCRACVPPKRHPGCHGECEEYKATRKRLDEENEQKRKKLKAIQDLFNVRDESIKKARMAREGKRKNGDRK